MNTAYNQLLQAIYHANLAIIASLLLINILVFSMGNILITISVAVISLIIYFSIYHFSKYFLIKAKPCLAK